MKTISDLPGDLVEEEIFSRVPLTCLRSVRSTCKKWNALSKKLILGKAAARSQYMGFMMMDHRVCWMEFDLRNMVGPCIKQVSILDQIGISYIVDCDGLLLCVIKNDKSRLLIWNPYLGQTRWIQPRTEFDELDCYSLGYDKYGNHKILRFFFCRSSSSGHYDLGFEIYDFSSNSWKALDVTPDWEFQSRPRFGNLKGNIYFCAKKTTSAPRVIPRKEEFFLLCFDCTTESFCPRLPLPLPLPLDSDSLEVYLSLTCVRQEQLALLYQRLDWETTDSSIEFYLTDKIDPNAVSWRKFLITFNAFPVNRSAGSFFIDEEKKLAVVFDLDVAVPGHDSLYQTAHIIGEDGYLRSFNFGVAPKLRQFSDYKFSLPLVCSPYVPSLVQLQINQPGKCKQRHYHNCFLLQCFVCCVFAIYHLLLKVVASVLLFTSLVMYNQIGYQLKSVTCDLCNVGVLVEIHS